VLLLALLAKLSYLWAECASAALLKCVDSSFFLSENNIKEEKYEGEKNARR
jgi:hypothetical protein